VNSTDFKVLTKDHKPDLPEETARIIKAGAQVVRHRINASLAVSRAFGDSQYKVNKDLPPDQQRVIALPDVSLIYLQPDEFLFICCDGIFESFSNEGTIDYLRNHLKDNRDQAVVLSNMLTSVLKGGSRDNMSSLLIQLTDGTDYNLKDEFIVGTYYPAGNDTYLNGFRLDCEKHGLKWEDLEKTLCKTSQYDDFNLSARSMPTIALDKAVLAIKSQSVTRPGISKSSRNLMVPPSLLLGGNAETIKEKEEIKDKDLEKLNLPPTPSQISDNYDPHMKSVPQKSPLRNVVTAGGAIKSNTKRDPRKEKNGKAKTGTIKIRK
jgi:hypothetical protein